MHDEECEGCGMKYRDFRCGYSFQEVKDMLWVASMDPTDWVYRRRNTVLGKMHELKKLMWERHKEGCEEPPQPSESDEPQWYDFIP